MARTSQNSGERRFSSAPAIVKQTMPGMMASHELARYVQKSMRSMPKRIPSTSMLSPIRWIAKQETKPYSRVAEKYFCSFGCSASFCSRLSVLVRRPIQ